MPLTFADDELIVNYHDACVYGRDWNLLQSPTAWLNDACLHFHLTRLEQRHSETLFWDPSILSFLVHQCVDDEDLRDLAAGYHNFAGIQRIFCPINDNLGTRDYQTPGAGTHWSLLVIDRVGSENSSATSFHHFDSVAGNNFSAAQRVASQWIKLCRLLHNNTQDTSTVVIECETPKQQNGYDCGVHTLAAAGVLSLVDGSGSDNLRETYEKALADTLGAALRTNPSHCNDIRKQIAADILNVRKI